MNETIYVTTTIPYVNARPHVGFALELVQADVVARYHRLLGRTVRFQTGTDENAFKNVLTARREGVSTGEFVDRNTAAFRELVGALNASPDSFVRTTEDRHRRGVHALWRQLRPEDLYLKSYRGLYCVGCEDFYLERDLVDGCCPDHEKPPVEVGEQNWFFRLSAYQSEIEDLLTGGRLRVLPEKRRNEVLSFVRRGLEDISVSRLAERSGGWGISVPGDEAQVIYVWIDALVNYLSGLGFGDGEDWRGFWNSDSRKIHVIGKNVWKFHAVYWPALLLSAGLPLPDELVVHGFLTENGRKISKSLGNAIDPFECVARFGVDGVRYFLLRAVSPFDDGDFSTARLAERYRADLANGLGNLVSRIASLCERAGFARSDRLPEPPAAPGGFHDALEAYQYDRALDLLWATVARLNQEIDHARPWELLKSGAHAALRERLAGWLRDLDAFAYWLAPFLPGTSIRIRHALSGSPVRRCEPLFPQVE